VCSVIRTLSQVSQLLQIAKALIEESIGTEMSASVYECSRIHVDEETAFRRIEAAVGELGAGCRNAYLNRHVAGVTGFSSVTGRETRPALSGLFVGIQEYQRESSTGVG
jgi:hypothetical protein